MQNLRKSTKRIRGLNPSVPNVALEVQNGIPVRQNPQWEACCYGPIEMTIHHRRIAIEPCLATGPGKLPDGLRFWHWKAAQALEYGTDVIWSIFTEVLSRLRGAAGDILESCCGLQHWRWSQLVN